MNKPTVPQAAVRFVKSRDSATTILRKIGIKPRDYNLFIEKEQDNTLAVHVAKANDHIDSLMNPAPKVEAKSTAAPKTKKESGESVSNVARDLIREGKTNAEVWAVIQPKFSLDAKKRGYPAWYRFQLRRAGEKV